MSLVHRYSLHGSSPHAWGLQHTHHLHLFQHRFIPTCVGFTERVGAVIRTTPGSSPHAWGLRLLMQVDRHPRRFIPTCVGFTKLAQAFSVKLTVHPHMRGVYWSAAQCRGIPIGSSPHAWGLPKTIVYKSQNKRFIPTCVGFTAHGSRIEKFLQVHPHMRGVYVRRHAVNQLDIGSSPHAWGLRQFLSVPSAPLRFIPTCVGFTDRG